MKRLLPLLALLLPATLLAQTPADDLELDPAEPDFTVVDLPTTLRLPRHKLAFRVTHRFARPLGQGDFGDLAGDLFGFDGGAQIGLGLRFGLLRGTQLAVYRTSDRTIELSLQQGVLRQGGSPVGLSVIASVEGLDNFKEELSPRFGLVVSRKLGQRGALYADPAWVGNTNLRFPGEDDSTLVLGLGARVGLGAGVSLVGELSPRLAGFKGGPNGAPLATFGIEKRVGGHSFQINFSNDLGTTAAQIARGRESSNDWHIGFNITRKFF